MRLAWCGGKSVGLVKYRFGPFELQTSARELFKSGTRIKLRGQPYLILEVLLDRAGEVVTRDEIREKLWPVNTFVDFEHGLNTSVKKLRQILCDSPEKPRYIETVPRLGYRFIAPVEIVTEPAKVPAKAPAAESAPAPQLVTLIDPQPRRDSSLLWRLLGIGLAAVVLLGVTYVGVFDKWPAPVRQLLRRPSPTVNASVPAKRFGSIAVLPLASFSSKPAQEYFTDGMTDELITDLAQLGNMRVISRTSVMHYKGTNKTVPQIGRELGVDALVEGSVERVGDRVRIRVQLIDAASDRHLWARSYDHDFKDLLLLETTAAHDIAAEIQGQLAESASDSQPAAERSVHPQAYEAYLKGRFFSNQRSEAGLKKSIEYFQEAITRDPSFAAAYAGLAGSYSVMGSDEMSPAVARSKARAAATKALRLDPTLAEGHAQLGLVAFYYDWNWKQAEQEFRRAIELNPNYAAGHQWYSYYLRAMGRLPQALQEAQQAQQLDPLSLPINTTLAGRYRDLGQFDQAISAIQRTLELNPNFGLAHELLASIYEREGKLQSAIGEWRKAVEISQDNPSTLAALGHAYAVAGNQVEARKIAIRLEPISRQHYVSAWDMAVLYIGMNDTRNAFRWLEKSYNERESQLPFLQQDHRLDPVRSDPRFQSLLRRVGLPA